MCAIGAHEDVAVVGSVVGTVDGHTVVVLVETIHFFVHVDALLGHLTAEKVVQVSTGHNIFETPSTIIDSEQRNKTTLLPVRLNVVPMLLVRKIIQREGLPYTMIRSV